MTMPTARGVPANLLYNPGALYAAPLATAEPVDLTTEWTTVDPAWTFLGYTDQGSQFDYQVQTADIRVEEELDPLAVVPTGRTLSVRFSLAEYTATHLELAFNGGTLTAAVTGPPLHVAYYEPPDLGQEARKMIGYESEDSSIRVIFRRTLSAGNVATQFRRAPQKAILPVELRIEKLAGAVAPFRVLMNTARAAA